MSLQLHVKKRWFLERWFHGLKPLGREVGDPKRHFISNFNDFLSFISKCTTAGKPAFMSVQQFSGPNAVASAEKIFLDFDWKPDPSKAFREAVDVYSILKSHGVEPILISSGMKGYHVYAYLPAVVEVSKVGERKCSQFLRALVVELLGTSRCETLSLGVAADPKRLSRIPYTQHQVTKAICQPIDAYGKPVSFDIELAMRNPIPMELCKKAWKRASETRGGEDERIFTSSSAAREQLHEVFDVVESGLQDGKRRFIFYVLIPTLLLNGYSDDEIEFICAMLVKNSNADPEQYLDYIRDSITRNKTAMKEDRRIMYRLDTFLDAFPDLRKNLKSNG